MISHDWNVAGVRTDLLARDMKRIRDGIMHQLKAQKVNPEVIVCGLPPDPKRHWLRLLWKRKRHWQDVASVTQYVREYHPHMLPEWAVDLREHMRCVLRGLLGDG